MIPNAVIVLIGLWLSYSAIFSTNAAASNNWRLGVAGIIVAVSAILAWRRDIMNWQSRSNAVLGIGVAALALARFYIEIPPLALFWIVLLAGIAVAIGALWSVLYRSNTATVA